MNINEAIEQLQIFINNYENKEIMNNVKRVYGYSEELEQDYIATKVLINEIRFLKLENENLKELYKIYENEKI